MVRKVMQRKQNKKPKHKSKLYSRKPTTIQARRKPRFRPSYHNLYYCPKCFFIYIVDESMINGNNNNLDNEKKAKSQRKKPVYKKPAKRRKSLKWRKSPKSYQSSWECIYFG